MQCGAACLAMICRYYGKKVSLSYLEKEMHMGHFGVTMASIMSAAASIGLKNKAYRLTTDELSEIPSPAILHWDSNHFVVLYEISDDRKRFWIADPGNKCIRLGRHEFDKHFLNDDGDSASGGIAMILQPDHTFDPTTPCGQDTGIRIGFLKKYIKPFSRYFIHVFLALGIGSLVQLIFPFLTQWIVDIGIRNRDMGFIWLVLLGEMMLIASSAISSFIRGWIMLHISTRINLRMVDDFLQKLLRLPMRFFEVRSAGDILQRMSDHSRVQSFITEQSVNAAFSIITFIIFSCLLLSYSTLFFFVFAAFGILYILWIFFFMERRRVVDYEMFARQSRNQDQTFELLGAIQEIKLHGCSVRRLDRWRQTQGSLLDIRIKSYNLTQIRQNGATPISEAGNLLITVLAASYVIEGSISLGQMMAIQYIVGQLQAPLSQFVDYTNMIQDLGISFERIGDINGRENESKDGACTKPKIEEGIVLDSVCFGYDRSDVRPVIDNVSLKIGQCRTVAIVGGSGSGKSTLLKLMLGYYDTFRGDILIDGKPIGDYDLDWWRSRCGVVMQDSVIFRESVACNIAINDDAKEIDMDRVRWAAKVACIDDFIESLPLGYHTVLGEKGNRLSMGQKQRILIARAIYRDPEFVFLDEATNSLDASNEKKIVENLMPVLKNKNVVVIAHRLSTIRYADTIAVMDKGRLVEIGDHDSLMARHGYYFDLVRNQIPDNKTT